ncbi:MAG: hypothetical protein GKC03_08480 [Methanomassiliicoccales archaeon]|nr:hypothetical protein [Methanomassiliicoccales archaeon]NYT14490.1 hypothetical protein [Methanomassiliicoccales archaeon]
MVEETPYDEIIEETCPSCRRTVPQGTTKCPNCGFKIREEPPPSKPVKDKFLAEERAKERAGYAGTLIMISGLLAFITGLSMVVYPDPFINWYSQVFINLSSDAIMIWGAIMLVFGLISIVGGVRATRRRSWSIATLGGFLGFIASGGFFLGTIFGLIGLILVVISKDEFKD